MTAVYGGVAWLVGIWLAAQWGGDIRLWLVGGGGGVVAAVLLRRFPALRLGLLCLGAAGLGGARYLDAQPVIDQTHVAFYNGSDDVTLEGVVVREPDVRDRVIQLRVAAERITLANGVTRPVSGEALVRVWRYPPVPYGARIRVNGRIETPPELDDFSYRDYLARQGIYSLVNLPSLTILETGAGHPLYHAIFAFKERAARAVGRLMANPEAALLSGILLGNDNGIPPALEDQFQLTGMTHIIAISGFNIAILIGLLTAVTEPWLGRRVAVALIAPGVILYTLLVGADPSVVRAALMGVLYLIATRGLGRPAFALASLFLAAVAMTLHNPDVLWQVGFQLSFAATLGLMLYAEPIANAARRRLRRWVDRDAARLLMSLLSDALFVTLAAQILTLPLIAAHFGRISLVSLPANFLILPAQPGVMLWGGAATLAGMVWAPLGQLLGWVAWLFLHYTLVLVRLFAAVPGATLSLRLSPAGLAGIYALIGLVTWWGKQDPERRAGWGAARARLRPSLLAGGSLIAALLVLNWGMAQPDGRLHVTFFDVGHGDATFIQTPSGRQILIDGGPRPSVLLDHLGREMPFWDRRLDLLVATHPDSDHVAGLVEVFARYQVDRLLGNGAAPGQSQVYDALLAAAAETETAVHPLLAGEEIIIGDGVRLQALHPGPERALDRDANSVVLRLVYGDFSLLLPGDAAGEVETWLLENGRVAPTLVYKAGHHGAETAATPPFLAALRPRFAVISAGAGNREGLPHPDALNRLYAAGTAVLRTDELGTISVASDGERIWWQAGP